METYFFVCMRPLYLLHNLDYFLIGVIKFMSLKIAYVIQYTVRKFVKFNTFHVSQTVHSNYYVNLT